MPPHFFAVRIPAIRNAVKKSSIQISQTVLRKTSGSSYKSYYAKDDNKEKKRETVRSKRIL
jgi:hypothetical protein